MPIYEYVCDSCSLKFELLRPLSRANEDSSCPQCHNKAKRILSCFSAFSESGGGMSNPIAGGSSCGTCAATSCATCSK